MTNNQKLLSWIDEITTLCQPDKVVWFDEFEEQQESILEDLLRMMQRLSSIKKNFLIAIYLDPISPTLPVLKGAPLFLAKKEEDAGPTNNWYPPKELKEKMLSLYEGAMKGRTLFVIPFCMGPINSPASRIRVQITDSPYVALNMKIMTRVGQPVLDRLGDDGLRPLLTFCRKTARAGRTR